MAILTGSTVLGTSFSAAIGDFAVQAVGGTARLYRTLDGAPNWTVVGELGGDISPVIANPDATILYKFESAGGPIPSVMAKQ